MRHYVTPLRKYSERVRNSISPESPEKGTAFRVEGGPTVSVSRRLEVVVSDRPGRDRIRILTRKIAEIQPVALHAVLGRLG
jgi:hypothetical protein